MMKKRKEKKRNSGEMGRMGLLLFFLRGAKFYFGLSVLFVCGLVIFELLSPKLIGYTVDFITGEALPAFADSFVTYFGGREHLLMNLWMISLVVLSCALIGAVFRYLFRLYNSKGAERLVERARNTLYEHITHLPFSWHDNNRTGDIIQRCTSDVDMVKNFLSDQLTNLVRMIVMIALALLFMSRIHVGMTLASAAFIPIVILYSFFFHNRIGASFEKVDTEEGRLSAIVQENLTGVRVVRAFGRESYERDRFEKKNEMYTGLWIRMMRILSQFWISNDAIGAIQTLTIICLGAYFAVQGNITAGDFVAFTSLNGLITFPVRQLGRIISEMSKAGISIDRLRYIMNSKREEDALDAGDFPESRDIVFSHVTFSYGENKVLDDVSFSVKQGQTLGILGGTGSGKTTLLQLLDHLYELPEDGGCITIGGVDIRKIKRSELRKNIGYVLQEPYLFSGTLEENVKIAVSDAEHSDVEEAVKSAALDTAIGKFKDGYETYVGERGVTLSGGQKQRTAIAQMLIRKTGIMFFDDSLSAVDSQTDKKIRVGIREASRDATVFLVSHRVTTLMQADVILVLEDGKVKEMGSHDELLRKGGSYHDIYELQTEGLRVKGGQE